MPKPTEPRVLSDQNGILTRRAGNDGLVDEAQAAASVAHVAARLAGSDLDPASLEMIMAALMAEECDQNPHP